MKFLKVKKDKQTLKSFLKQNKWLLSDYLYNTSDVPNTFMRTRRGRKNAFELFK